MIGQDIIQGCIRKNSAAQEAFYNELSPKMMAICYRFAHHREDAEDMLQEGFIKVLTQIHTFENKGPVEAWVRRIIVYTCINYLKKHKKLNDIVELSYADDISGFNEKEISNALQGKQIMECIRLLPIGYRAVFNLFALEGYSHKEIADMLNIGESTSRSQYTRAKVLLENILIDKGIVEPARKAKSA